MENYKFFQNKACEYFPCHKMKEDKDFNCLFCYCPLYALKEQCGGNFTYTEKGIKNCMGCIKPHTLTGYDHIQKHIGKVIELGKKARRDERMGRLILVTGGTRSGKSSYAESLCKAQNNSTAYIATSIPFDAEMKDRVKKHQEMRPKDWTTYEAYENVYKEIPEIAKSHNTVLLDCITLMVNNIMFNQPIDFETCITAEIDQLEALIKRQVELLIQEVQKTNLYFVIVTNEIGMGVIGATKLTRIYTDIIGRINQQVAASCDEVYFIVSGLSMKIRG